jgi:hypothetical protein
MYMAHQLKTWGGANFVSLYLDEFMRVVGMGVSVRIWPAIFGAFG